MRAYVRSAFIQIPRFTCSYIIESALDHTGSICHACHKRCMLDCMPHDRENKKKKGGKKQKLTALSFGSKVNVGLLRTSPNFVIGWVLRYPQHVTSTS